MNFGSLLEKEKEKGALLCCGLGPWAVDHESSPRWTKLRLGEVRRKTGQLAGKLAAGELEALGATRTGCRGRVGRCASVGGVVLAGSSPEKCQFFAGALPKLGAHGGMVLRRFWLGETAGEHAAGPGEPIWVLSWAGGWLEMAGGGL
jgi:hypothetical protein